MRAFVDTRSPTPGLAAMRLLQELFAGCEDDDDRRLRWSNIRLASSHDHAVFQSRLIDAVSAAPVTVELKRELVARIARNDLSWFFEEGRDGEYTVPMQRKGNVAPEPARGQAAPAPTKKKERDDPFQPMDRPAAKAGRPIRTSRTDRAEFLSRGVIHPDQAWVNRVGVFKAYEMMMPLTPGLVMVMSTEEQIRSMCEHVIPKRFQGELLMDLCMEGEPALWNTYPGPITYGPQQLYETRQHVLPFYDRLLLAGPIQENPHYRPSERQRIDADPALLNRAIELVYHLSVGVPSAVVDKHEWAAFWPRGGPRTAEGIRTFRGYFREEKAAEQPTGS